MNPTTPIAQTPAFATSPLNPAAALGVLVGPLAPVVDTTVPATTVPVDTTVLPAEFVRVTVVDPVAVGLKVAPPDPVTDGAALALL